MNLDIALKLRDELIRRGFTVAMTRTGDRYIGLQERVDLTDAQKADLFVSIHANDYPNPAVEGSLVLYYDSAYPQADYPASDAMARLTPESKRLAQSVLDGLTASAGTVNRGIVPSAVYVIRRGHIPGILVETAFLSNPGDAARLADDASRKQMAAGIADGIGQFLHTGSGGTGGNVVFPDTLGHWARDAILRLKEKGIAEGVNNRFEPDRPVTRAEFLTLLNRIFPFPTEGDLAGAGPAGKPSLAAAPRDLPASHWAYGTFMKAIAAGYIDGYANGTVRPDASLTRGEAAALFDRMLVPNSSRMKSFSADFQDVPAALWSARPIYYLKQRGLLDGAAPNRFLPEKSMTRAEIAAMLDRYVRAKAAAAPVP